MSDDYSPTNIVSFKARPRSPDQAILANNISAWLRQAIEIGGLPPALIALRLDVDVAFVENLASTSADLSSVSLAQLLKIAEIMLIDPLSLVLIGPTALHGRS